MKSWSLAALLTGLALLSLRYGTRPDESGPAHYRLLGAALVRGEAAPAPLSVSYRMPLATASAALGARLPPPLWDAARLAALALLLTALAGALGSPWSAPVAAVLWSHCAAARGALPDHVQVLYTLAVLAVALALLRRARAPGREATALLALALGSLLARALPAAAVRAAPARREAARGKRVAQTRPRSWAARCCSCFLGPG